MGTERGVMRAIVGITAAGLLLAACSSSTGTSTASSTGGASEPVTAAASPTASDSAMASPDAPADDGPAPKVDRTIRVGIQTIGSNRVVAELYARALKDAGFDVALTVPGTVDTFVEAMAEGQVDVLPVYATRFTDYLYTSILDLGGSRPVTRDLDSTVAAANEYGADRGIRLLASSQAADQPRFAITRAFAQQTGITTLSGLAVWSRTNPLRLGGNPTCEYLAFCKPSLEKTYSMRFKEFVPLSADGTVVKGALNDGSIELGYFFGTDPVLASPDLVVLEDDIPRPIFNNATPALRSAFATPEVVTALDSVSAALTQQDLEDLVFRVNVKGEEIGRVASDWLGSKGIGKGLFDGPLTVDNVVLSRTASGSTATESPTESSTAASNDGRIRISYAPLFDTEVAARIYAGALVDAGYRVSVGPSLDPEEILAKLPMGEVQLAPMRTNVIANILNTQENGPLVLPIRTRNVPELMGEARDLAQPLGISVLPPSNANVGNAFVVNKEYVAQTGARTLSDLARVSQSRPIVVGGPPTCPDEAWCLPYLRDGYGIKVKKFVPLDAGGAQSRTAAEDDAIDVVWLSGNDGGIDEFGFIVLDDDLGRDPVNPIAPVMQQSAVEPGIARVLNRVSEALTTEAIRDMSRRVEFEREEMNDVVRQFLRDNDLDSIDMTGLSTKP